MKTIVLLLSLVYKLSSWSWQNYIAIGSLDLATKSKTWVRSKEQIIICGKCEVCNKELTSIMGGWIVNAEKKRFCHNGIDELCFDKYINNRKNNAGLSY